MMEMISLDNPVNIAIAIVIVIIILLAIRSVKRRTRDPSRKLEKLEDTLEQEEHELKQIFRKKSLLFSELRKALARKDSAVIKEITGRVKGFIDQQEKILHDLSHIDTLELRHLRHIGVSLGRKERHHVSEVVAEIKRQWGAHLLDSPSALEKKRKELANLDSFSRGVGYLAVTILHIESQVTRISKHLSDQKAWISVSRIDINKLESSAHDEGYDIDYIISNSRNVKVYMKQLAGTEHIAAEGPFLKVLGHSVDVVTNRMSGAREVVGKGDRISLGLLPDPVVFGSDQRKCDIVLNNGTPDIAAKLTKRKGDFCMLQKTGGSPEKINNHHKFEFDNGYEFEFES